MLKYPWILAGAFCLTLVACGPKTETTAQAVSQKYIHKYGFELSEEEWNERDQTGQIISSLENGRIKTSSFANGILHGPTTYTYPNSPIVEKTLVYDEGRLLKTTFCDTTGVPTKEEAFEFDNIKVVTYWDINGVPLSIEEYQNDTLVKGQYFTSSNDLESIIQEGTGLRCKRDRSTGALLYKDEFKNGELISRISFHPNGEIQAKSCFSEYKLNGKQYVYSSAGLPLMEVDWKHGFLHGQKVLFQQGVKIAEIPYLFGRKNGIESRYDEKSNLVSQVHWKEGLKHGSSRFFAPEGASIEWFYKDQLVTSEEFDNLLSREKMLSNLYGDGTTPQESSIPPEMQDPSFSETLR